MGTLDDLGTNSQVPLCNKASSLASMALQFVCELDVVRPGGDGGICGEEILELDVDEDECIGDSCSILEGD